MFHASGACQSCSSVARSVQIKTRMSSTVAKALTLLEHFSEDEPEIGLSGLARMSGLDLIGVPQRMNMMPMERYGTLFGMWSIMMAAMMLPTLVPTLSTYDALIASADGTRAGWIGVLLGYFAVWVGGAAIFGGAQALLFQIGLIDSLGIPTSIWVSVALLIAVGVYQFTWIKEVCHGVCHTPMQYFLGHWKTGFTGGARMGAGLGVYCLGCCWGFMALGFVGGTMSLLWMGLATFVMILEKVPAIGHKITRPLGVVLIGAGVVLALWHLFI